MTLLHSTGTEKANFAQGVNNNEFPEHKHVSLITVRLFKFFVRNVLRIYKNIFLEIFRNIIKIIFSFRLKFDSVISYSEANIMLNTEPNAQTMINEWKR